MRKVPFTGVLAAAVMAIVIPTSPAMAAGGAATGADLQVSGSANVGSPVQGQPYLYTWQVKNSGPRDALSVTFASNMTAGTVGWAQVQAPTFATNCSLTGDGASGTLISCPMSIAKGVQETIVASVTAPTTIGSYPTTGTATAARLVDPKPGNNSSTVTVKVGSAACPVPADQPTVTGVVAGKFNDANGNLAGFRLYGNDGVTYTVLANFFSAPLTNTINLLCKAVPATLYIQVSNTDKVTGTIGMEVLPGDTVATPVIHATLVQTPYWTDKVA